MGGANGKPTGKVGQAALLLQKVNRLPVSERLTENVHPAVRQGVRRRRLSYQGTDEEQSGQSPVHSYISCRSVVRVVGQSSRISAQSGQPASTKTEAPAFWQGSASGTARSVLPSPRGLPQSG